MKEIVKATRPDYWCGTGLLADDGLYCSVHDRWNRRRSWQVIPFALLENPDSDLLAYVAFFEATWDGEKWIIAERVADRDW